MKSKDILSCPSIIQQKNNHNAFVPEDAIVANKALFFLPLK
jgi:hypothetical protein